MKQRITAIFLLIAVLLTMMPTVMAADENEAQTTTATVFEQDFNANQDLSGWTKDGYSKTDWTFGDFKQYLTVQEPVHSIVSTGDTAWTDYTYSADVMITGGSVSPGLTFRYQDSNNFYTFLYTHTEKLLRLYKRVGGTFTEFASAQVSRELAPGTFYHFSVTVSGNKITCYIDDEQVMSVTDSTFSSGKVGLRLYYNSETSDRAYISNAAVTVNGNITLLSQNAADWSKDFGSSNWAFTGLDKYLYMSKSQAAGRVFLTTGDAWENATYSVDIAVTAQNGGLASPGLVFGAQDASNLYLFMYANDADAYRLYKRVNGVFTKIGADVVGTLEPNRFYRFSASMNNGLITCAVDGQTVITATDSTFSSGKFGVQTYYQSASGDLIYFSNPKVVAEVEVDPPVEDTTNLPYTENLTTSGAANWSADQAGLTAGTSGLTGNGISSVGDISWVNYSYSANVELGEGTNIAPGILFRYQDVDNFYMFLYTALEQEVQLYKRAGGTFTKLLTKKHPLASGEHTLTASVLGSDIHCMVDGSEVLTLTDSTFTHGKVGIRITGADFAAVKNISVAAAPANALFFEDFDTLDTGVWNAAQNGNFQLRESQGTNWITSTGDGLILADADTAEWSNYEVRAHVRMEGFGGYNAPGLIFYGQDAQNFYMVHFSKFDKKVMLYKRVGNQFIILAEAGCEMASDTNFEYKVHVFDGTITVYIDGITVLQLQDSTYSGGCIGYRSYTNGNPSAFGLMDNILVYPVNGEAVITERLPEGVLFQETFARDLSNWTGDGFAVSDGVASGNGEILAGSDDDSQYRLETVIRNGDGTMGLTSHGGAYSAGIDFGTDIVTLYRGDTAVAQKTWAFTDETTLTVTVNGTTVSVWADGSKMMDYTDDGSAPLAGKFGIWSEDSSGVFDSVTVYKIGVADTLPGDYAYELPPEPLTEAPTVTEDTYYVSPNGNDSWSGKLDRPNAENTDGPFASIQTAAGAAAAHPGHDTVLIRGGTYYLEDTVVLTQGDVTFAAYPDETPLISGGRKVTTEWIEQENGIWKTILPDAFEGVEIHQVFVENARATRSREPDGETWTVRAVDTENYSWIIPNGDIPEVWEGLTGVEMNSRGTWHYNRQTVASFDAKTDTVTSNLYIGVQASGLKISVAGGSHSAWAGNDWLYFENALLFVDTEGEWFYDNAANELYYYPVDGADPNALEIVIPVLETLVEVTGMKNSPVENLDFYGLTFAHTTWSLNPLGTDIERRGIQGGFWGNLRTDPVYAPSAAVIYTYAQCSRIQNCLFTHTGEGGIAFGAGADSNLIYACEFDDVGANCIQVGWRATYTGYGHPLEKEWDDDTDAPQGNQIVQNYIHDSCTTDQGSVGIWTGYSNHNLIEHNTIVNMPYSGMNVGWRWSRPNSYGNAYNTTSSHNNTIQWNYVLNTMQTMADGGAIYCVGEQWSNKVLHNYVNGSHGTGIYLDECSNYTEVGYNYYENIALTDFNLNTIYAGVATNYFHDHYIDQAPTDPSIYGNTVSCGPTVDGKFAVNFTADAEDAVIAVMDGNTSVPKNDSSFDAWQLSAGSYTYTATLDDQNVVSGSIVVTNSPVDITLTLKTDDPDAEEGGDKDDDTPCIHIPVKPASPAVASVTEKFPFADVDKSAWYYDEVKEAWENDLIDGMTATSFDPNGKLTVAQAIKLAAALHQMDKSDKVTLTNGNDIWYSTYVSYAIANGIIDETYGDYTWTQMNAAVTRKEFVHIFYGVTDYYAKKNTVADNAIPDVKMDDACANEIYTFYRAGIVIGSDEAGTFYPNSNIKRSEAAAILIRMYDVAARKTITLGE